MPRFALQNECPSHLVLIGQHRQAEPFCTKKSKTSENFPAHRFPRLATAVFSDGALDPVSLIRVSS